MIYSGKISNIDQIIISDPGYAECVWCRYENKNLNAKNWDIDIIVEKYEENIDGYDIKGTDIRLMLHDPNIKALMQGEKIRYPNELECKEYTIGMDTASVSIGINEVAERIRTEKDLWQPITCLRTLTDGQFGCVVEGIKDGEDKPSFIFMSGYLDEDTGYTMDEILDYFKKNLKIESLAPNITISDTEIETFLVDANGIDVSLATWFDVDEKFGTHVNDEDGHWVNLYALYNPETDVVTCTYAVDTPEKITHYDYSPSVYEKEVIKKLIDDYCLKEKQMTARDVYEQVFKEDMVGGIEQ